jgi:predicted DNA-binding protein with PD1-like motif
MKYQVGDVGRCIVARFEDGDSILDKLVEIARKEDIRAAIVYLIGGITEATIVVGPDKEELPPNPVWRTLTESHEAAAIGTIFWEGNEPKIHVHGSYGKRDMVKVGCLRDKANTFLVLEAIILEITGVKAVRELDPKSNMVLLKL